MTADAESTIPPGLDVPGLTAWLAATLPGLGALGSAELIAGGRSNLTYRLRLAGGDVVLRRPPLGHVLPTAHDMAREHRVLSALAGSAVPVPRPLALCADTAVLGAPFYVMEYVEGRVLRTLEDGADVTPEQAAALSDRLAEVLATIHTVDLGATGLDGFGRPEGYMARQLKRWGRQWDSSHAARPDPGPLTADYERLVARLAERLPEDGPQGLVHGDFRLDNVLLDPADPSRVAAVLDWELSTLGDPLADLGLLLFYWAEPGEPAPMLIPTVISRGGFPGRAHLTERYARLR